MPTTTASEKAFGSLSASQLFGGPFLCGGFGLVDAFFAPVVMRFTSYDVQLPPELAAYCEAVRTQPFVADWLRLARADTKRNPAYSFTR